ncbi:hypothetical protein [Pelosinus sp. IPA-1]|uniref:hypothetical protein n=1 Tax=Pelosinus sp. IPA-1 TaxID=3029569 RepID=UPI0025523F57|nr:hypothetical protein [Pelosinus sp. IPA-1]
MITGIIHPFEVVVMLTDGYRYIPGIVLDPQTDSTIGAFISDLFIVPALAVVINALSLSWPFILGITAAFTGIDWLYVKIGVYEHYWWKSIYTGSGLIILYAISRWFWHCLQEKKPSLLFRLLAIYLTYIPIPIIINFVLARLLNVFKFEIYLLSALEKNHPVFNNVYLIFTGVVVTLCIGLRLRFRYRLFGIGLLALVSWALEYYNIFVSPIEMSSQYLTLVPLVGVLFVIVLFHIAKLDYLF